jgi:putative peptidoglycan lipid II flippase
MTRGVAAPAAPEAGAPESVEEMMRNAPPGGFPHASAGMRETSTDLPSLSYQPEESRRRRPLPPLPPRSRPSPAGSAQGNWLRDHRWVAVIAVAVIVVIAVVVASTQLLGGGSGATASGAAAAGLPVSFDVAYGPNGVADGDNADSASYPVTSGSTLPWTTRQYSSAQFGGKQGGTGLLLDMGSSVTVTSVTVSLGSEFGASLRLQAGKAVTELSTAASAANAGGDVILRPGKPVAARYLLVWFTQLPQSSDGRYQASVSRITVNGHP